jgi:hypothetical protein
MKNTHPKRRTLWILLAVILVLAGVIIALVLTLKPMPLGLISQYDLGMLWHEGIVMNDCAECHNTDDFHTCETCHDDHGAVELADVRFYEVVELTGDVPDPSFVRVNEILPDQGNLGTHITLFKFLAQNGVDDFVSVTFLTNDGGLATITKENLDDTAMLVPYMDGVRFITESVHSSTWLKGIKKIIVVGTETPLWVDGTETSIGRLMIGEIIRTTVEGSEVMLTDESGDTNTAIVANWAEGAPLLPLLANQNPSMIIVTDADGNETELQPDQIGNALIGIIKDQLTLILPDRGRSAWPMDIVRIESK